MFKGLGDLANLAREAGKIKERVEALQAELAEREVESSSGGGMVTVRVNGRQEILSVSIGAEILESGDRQMLEDLVTAAANAALARSKEMMREELAKIAGGLNISLPGLI